MADEIFSKEILDTLHVANFPRQSPAQAEPSTDETWNPGVPDRIDLTPTWETAARIYAAVLENGTGEGKSSALAGLLEMGRILDQFNQGVSREDIQAARRANNA